jgi:hypothetical protein
MNLQDIENSPHTNIMNREDYFDLCRDLTNQHNGSFATYHRGLFDYTKPWSDDDLGPILNRKFFTNRDGVNEYTEAQLAVPGVLESTFLSNGNMMAYLKELLGLRILVAARNYQEPGQVVGTHSDHFRALVRAKTENNEILYSRDIRRFAVFLDDQEIGHSFMVGLESLSWYAGDVVEFPWYALHATANAGLSTKRLIFVAGVY